MVMTLPDGGKKHLKLERIYSKVLRVEKLPLTPPTEALLLRYVGSLQGATTILQTL